MRSAWVAQGIDCTQWAMSHGIAMTSTATRSESATAKAYRAKLAEETALLRATEAQRAYLAKMGQLHQSHEYNNGKTDTQRMLNAQNMQTSWNDAQNYNSGLSFVLNGSAPWTTSSTISWTPATAGQTYVVNPLLNQFSQEPPVVVSGKQFVVVCNGRVEYEDDKAKAQATAERLAHANQQDAFILKPISRTAPKRDVVTTEIKL